MQPLIALADANNFYVSCERVFRPDLIGKPVAVLSNIRTSNYKFA
jgi:DNA polymerase V